MRRALRPSATPATAETSAAAAAPPAAPQQTTRERVGAAFLAIMAFHDCIRSNHKRSAKEIDMPERLSLARKATRAALRMEKAMLALIGTHRRRTYARDIVYGTHMLYVLYARPWKAERRH